MCLDPMCAVCLNVQLHPNLYGAQSYGRKEGCTNCTELMCACVLRLCSSAECVEHNFGADWLADLAVLDAADVLVAGETIRCVYLTVSVSLMLCSLHNIVVGLIKLCQMVAW